MSDGTVEPSESPEPRPRVLVLFGGRSSEHSVSCLSAGGVLDQIDRDRFEVLGVGITREGAWVLGPADGRTLRLQGPDGRQLPSVTGGEPVALPAEARSPELIHLDPSRAGEVVGGVDVVLPMLHGPGGEDGAVQGLFETVGVPYVGAGVCASAAAMDKDVTKRLLRADGIAVGDWVTLRPGEDTVGVADRERLGLPVFVKPARAGSSVGITRVTDWADLDAAIAHAREQDPKVLVEAGVVGREVECGVLEHPDGSVRASVPAEIRVTGGDAGWYDFETKYLDGSASGATGGSGGACELDVPAKLDDDVAEAVRATAVRVFAAMDCSGLARVDFFLTEASGATGNPSADGRLIVNEINTMPGFTATSLFPRMWATTGVDYPTLLTTLIETARARGIGLR